jgi:hypothetical protein
MNITLGSLLSEDIRALQDLDLLPKDLVPDDIQAPGRDAVATPSTQQDSQAVTQSQRSGRSGGLSWFEEMLDGSRLGRVQNLRRGIGLSPDGSTRVEWEISEVYDAGNGDAELGHTSTGSKRKIGDVGGNDDTKMQE